MFGRIWNKDEELKESAGRVLSQEPVLKAKPVMEEKGLPDIIETGITGRYSLHQLFDIMITKDISDLHILPEYPPVFRLYGEIIPSDLPPLTPDGAKTLIYQSISKEEVHKFEETGDLDSSYEARGIARFRTNVLLQQNGGGSCLQADTYKNADC